MQKLFGICVLLIGGLMGPASAWADDTSDDDQVVFSLTDEGWVSTDSAVVHVNAEAVQQGETADQLKKSIKEALGKLSAKGEWRFTHFNRSHDKTGLTRWNANVQARLPERELTGLQDRAKEVSKPGFRITIATTDFSPSLDEFELARSDLRQRLYQRIGRELTLLNSAFPERGYRLKDVYFDRPPSPRPYMRGPQPAVKMMTMSEAAIAPAPPAEIGVERKITMTVNVVFAARIRDRDE